VTTPDQSLAFYEYRRNDARMVVFWACCRFVCPKDDAWEPEYERPGDSFVTRPDVFETAVAMESPVWVDLLSGRAYEIPSANQLVSPAGVTLVDVPVYDSPCLLAERRAIADILR